MLFSKLLKLILLFVFIVPSILQAQEPSPSPSPSPEPSLTPTVTPVPYHELTIVDYEIDFSIPSPVDGRLYDSVKFGVNYKFNSPATAKIWGWLSSPSPNYIKTATGTAVHYQAFLIESGTDYPIGSPSFAHNMHVKMTKVDDEETLYEHKHLDVARPTASGCSINPTETKLVDESGIWKLYVVVDSTYAKEFTADNVRLSVTYKKFDEPTYYPVPHIYGLPFISSRRTIIPAKISGYTYYDIICKIEKQVSGEWVTQASNSYYYSID